MKKKDFYQKFAYRSDLVGKDLNDEIKEELYEDFICASPYGLIKVPKGFITDFASIPPGIRWIIKRKGKYNKASVIHDYLYRFAKLNPDYPDGIITREIADYVMKGFMILSGVGCIKRNVILAGLKVGGWITWGKYRKLDELNKKDESWERKKLKIIL